MEPYVKDQDGVWRHVSRVQYPEEDEYEIYTQDQLEAFESWGVEDE